MIYEKQKVMGWISQETLAKLESGNNPYKGHAIHPDKTWWKDWVVPVPCYYNPPEHPSAVMNNVFECVVSINNLFDERSK
jgi:hypothetical protein